MTILEKVLRICFSSVHSRFQNVVQQEGKVRATVGGLVGGMCGIGGWMVDGWFGGWAWLEGFVMGGWMVGWLGRCVIVWLGGWLVGPLVGCAGGRVGR